MASYFEWNESLARHFSYRLATGEVFYLSVDEDALNSIGRHYFAEGSIQSPVQDFELAVRTECVSDGSVVLHRQHLFRKIAFLLVLLFLERWFWPRTECRPSSTSTKGTISLD